MERVVLIEDNDTIRQGMEQILRKEGLEVFSARGGKDGVALVERCNPRCVITDLKMDDLDGIAVLQKIRELRADLPVMIITAFGTIEKAVEAMRLGAHDFITKPFPPDLLRVKVRQALDMARLAEDRDKLFFENQYLRDQEGDRYVGRELLGKSAVMQKIHSQIGKIAKTQSSVFISGESGTGKELVARAIHQQSSRRDKPFIKVNCSALAEGVLESELFGHERGAFTGAIRRKPGRFELADGGTLFLDEIGDIHHSIQLKLLRVLQEREFERVGGTQTIKVDVRVISATNQDLQAQIQRGLFREDLFYRLVIVPLNLPPLRERREDIPQIAQACLQRLAKSHGKSITGFTPAALEALKNYRWPGNVRELENMLEQAVVFSDKNQLDVDILPISLRNFDPPATLEATVGECSLPEILDLTERRLIEQAIGKAGRVKTRVAKLLGIKTSALYYKLEKYGLLEGFNQDES